jgi:hypothetical protein
MTLEMAIIAAVRIAGSLPVLRWPFWGGVLAVAVDQSDLLLMNLLDLGGVEDYQSFDKFLDQVYLLAFLIVALRWERLPRNVAVALYIYRLAGFAVFEFSGARQVLLFFPNLFEVWFLLIAALKQFRPQLELRAAPLLAAMAPLVALKLFQEYAIHYARWLDDFTTVEAIEATWRWLSGPLR